MTNPPGPSTSRRRLLSALGATGLSALSGCSSWDSPEPDTSTPETTRSPDGETTREPTATTTPEQYDNVVDIVEAGGDPDGNEPIEPVLKRVIDDDTLVRFPPGTYLVGSIWEFGDVSNAAVVGDRATLIPGEGLKYWLLGTKLEDFTLAGFTLDHRGANVGPQVQLHATRGKSVVRDLTVRGFHDSEKIVLIPNVETEDASLLIERLRIPDGTKGVPAVFMGPRSVGKISFVDCYLEHCAQGIYGSAHSGPFHVVGGTYANNNKCAIRTGGGSSGAHIRGVHVRIDNPIPDRWTNRKNLRGIWLREGYHSVVEDCTIEMVDLKGAGSDGAIHIDDLMGRATIRNTKIRTDQNVRALRAQAPSKRVEAIQGNQGLPEERQVVCENLQVTGDANRDETIRVMGRNGSAFRNLTIDQPNGSRRGLVIGSNATDISIEGGSWVTGHYPLVVEADRQAVTDGTCPVRIENVVRFEATNLTDGGVQLANGNGGSYCVDGVAEFRGNTNVAIAVAAVKNGAIFGKRMSTDMFRRAYEN